MTAEKQTTTLRHTLWKVAVLAVVIAAVLTGVSVVFADAGGVQVVSAPEIVDPDGDRRGHIVLTIRNASDSTKWPTITTTWSEDSELGKDDIRGPLTWRRINAGDEATIERRMILTPGYYFVQVREIGFDRTYTVRYNPPPDFRVMPLRLALEDLTDTKATFAASVTNNSHRDAKVRAWLVEAVRIDEAPYLVYEPVGRQYLQPWIEQGQTRALTFYDRRIVDLPDRMEYKVCIGPVYNNPHRCSLSVNLDLRE